MSERPVVSAAAVLCDGRKVLVGWMPHRGWVFPGGKVEWGEPVRQTVVRELREETGLEVLVQQLFGVYDLIGQHDAFGESIEPYHKVITVWRCALVEGTTRVPQPSAELTAVRWCTLLELVTLRQQGELSLVGAEILADLAGAAWL